VAGFVAVLADALQLIVFPFFVEGAESPADDVLDCGVAGVMLWLLGWQWEFLPSVLAKLVPNFTNYDLRQALFMNQPVHIRTLAGSAQLPCWLREPYMFPSQHVIQAQFANLSGVAVNTRMFLDGAQYYTWSPALQRNSAAKELLVAGLKKWQQRRPYVTPFWLTTDTPIALTAGQTANFNSKIGDDGHVELFTLMAVSTGTFGFSVQEVKTKQTLMNGIVTGTNAAGNAQYPCILATPYLVPAGYNLQYTVWDLSGAPNNIYLTWQARKICSATGSVTPGNPDRTRTRRVPDWQVLKVQSNRVRYLCCDPAREHPTRRADVSSAGAARGLIMVIEDDALIQMLVCETLMSMGHEICAAAATEAEATRLDRR